MSRHSITPPRVKFELRAYGEVYDLTNSIANWKDLEYTLSRDETSGVFIQISFPFEFVLDAYDIVKSIFDKYQYRAKADMYIYLLKDMWPYEKEQYYEPQIFNLDWTSYDKSDNKIEIDSKRTSLFDFIKAKNKVVYDIPVREIKEEKPWEFDRIQLENRITYRCTSNGDYPIKIDYPGSVTRSVSVGVSYEEAEVAAKDIVLTNTIPFGKWYKADEWGMDKSLYFMYLSETAASTTFELDINITGKASARAGKFRDVSLHLAKIYDDPDFYKASYYIDLENGNIDWHQKVQVMLHGPGDGLYLLLKFHTNLDPYEERTLTINLDGTIKVDYQAKNKNLEVDLIDPKTLLQSLVDGMTDSRGVYRSDIEDFNTDKNNLIMMSAAESIRGIQTSKDDNDEVITEPKVHTSYRKFVEWMNAYGYEQHVDGDSLTFRKRNKGFRSDLTAIELNHTECADLREYINEKRLYSGMKIGYNRKDIENLNVRYEFNGEHDYATDLNLGENMLNLISPYRADCYGIEFLAQERNKDSTDDKSDKDLFLINVSENEKKYVTVRNKLSGNYPNQTLFNCNLNPYNLMLLNQDLVGISAKHLKFTASDSNSTIVIDGQPIDADHDIPEDAGLFDPIIYDIASKNIQNLPSGEHINGIVRFKYKGHIYEGFIEDVSKNPAWEMETTWILRKRKSAK